VVIEIRKVGRYQVMTLAGDIRGGEEYHDALRMEGHRALAERPFLALNCRRVTFVDSQTLGLFVELLRSAQARGGEVALTGITERVSKWFSLSGLDQLFRMLPDESSLTAGEKTTDSQRRRAVLDAVNIERMVGELQDALGEADESGGPSAPGAADEKILTEIEKLLAGMAAEEQD